MKLPKLTPTEQSAATFYTIGFIASFISIFTLSKITLLIGVAFFLITVVYLEVHKWIAHLKARTRIETSDEDEARKLVEAYNLKSK